MKHPVPVLYHLQDATVNSVTHCLLHLVKCCQDRVQGFEDLSCNHNHILWASLLVRKCIFAWVNQVSQRHVKCISCVVSCPCLPLPAVPAVPAMPAVPAVPTAVPTAVPAVPAVPFWSGVPHADPKPDRSLQLFQHYGSAVHCSHS